MFSKIENEMNCLFLNFWRSKWKRPSCSEILEEHNEAKWNLLQDLIKANVYVSYCEEEEKQIKTKLRFVLEQSEKKRI